MKKIILWIGIAAVIVLDKCETWLRTNGYYHTQEYMNFVDNANKITVR